MENNIFIIGAGAVGKALAVFLKLAGKNVTIIRGSVDNLPAKNELIQVQMADGNVLEAKIEVNSLSNYTEFKGILVLTNKSYGNKILAEKLKNKAKNSPIVLLQNGLGVEDNFIENGFTKIYRGVLFTTCELINNSLVKFKPVAVSQIGILKGKMSELQHIANQLNTDIFRFNENPNIQPLIWGKVIANCVFNSICPLLDVDNGIFIRNDEALNLGKKVIAECVAIANLSGVKITEDEVIKSVLIISKMSDGQLISTLQDIRYKRQTEIETLNFAIVKIAKKLKKLNKVPVTKQLGELTKMKADLNIYVKYQN